MKNFLYITLGLVFALLATSLPAEIIPGVKPGETGFIYSPVGKRDPFKQPAQTPIGRDLASENPLERYSLEQLQLRGILRGNLGSRAMFEDPDGKTHLLGEGDLVGREKGTVSRILNSEVIITLKTFNYLGAENIYEKVISLPPK